MKERSTIPLAEMPFYGSLERAQAGTGLDTKTLLQSQIGFAAEPAGCACGDHAWSVFDMMAESVENGHHDWSFFTQRDFSTAPSNFFSSREQLTCPSCQTKTPDISVLYNYGGHIYTDPK